MTLLSPRLQLSEYLLENKNTLCLFMVLLVINSITDSYMHASLTWNFGSYRKLCSKSFSGHV